MIKELYPDFLQLRKQTKDFNRYFAKENTQDSK